MILVKNSQKRRSSPFVLGSPWLESFHTDTRPFHHGKPVEVTKDFEWLTHPIMGFLVVLSITIYFLKPIRLWAVVVLIFLPPNNFTHTSNWTSSSNRNKMFEHLPGCPPEGCHYFAAMMGLLVFGATVSLGLFGLKTSLQWLKIEFAASIFWNPWLEGWFLVGDFLGIFSKNESNQIIKNNQIENIQPKHQWIIQINQIEK